MYTIFDYLEYYKDTNLNEININEIDNLLFSILVYLPISSFDKKMNFSEFANYALKFKNVKTASSMAHVAFEIISLLDYGFCYNYGFNHNENNLKNYNSSVNENYNFAFGENCNFVKYFNYDFVNIESKNYNLSKIGNYNSLNGSCYGFWRIYFICDNLKDFLFNTKNQKKF